MLEYSQIRELIKDIDNSSLREFQLECSDIKLKLSKNNNNYDDNEKGNNLDFEDSLIEKDEESIDESDILIDDKLEVSYIESDLNVENEEANNIDGIDINER